MRHWPRATRLDLWMVDALAPVGSLNVGAQVVLASVTTMSLGMHTQPNGAYTDAQALRSCCANTSITRGTDPTTDALLNTGRQVASLIPTGITFTTGIDTLYR